MFTLDLTSIFIKGFSNFEELDDLIIFYEYRRRFKYLELIAFVEKKNFRNHCSENFLKNYYLTRYKSGGWTRDENSLEF